MARRMELRRIDAQEVDRFIEAVSVPFLSPVVNDDDRKTLAQWRPFVDPDRSFAVFDRDRIVANAANDTRRITLPAGPDGLCPDVPFTAVTAVGVQPTHRRRGLLRRLMGALLTDGRERGEAFAALTASESAIYGRFGFGWATTDARFRLAHPRHVEFVVPAPDVDIELLWTDEDVRKVVPGAFERTRHRSPGQVDRPDVFWDEIVADRADERSGGGGRFWALTDGGVAAWNLVHARDAHGSTLRIRDLVGETAEIEAALWRFVLDIDLVTEVVADQRPPADPIRHRLVDPRGLETVRVEDKLWVRILDMPATLMGRRYLHEGRLVLDVLPPPATPDASGEDRPDPTTGRWVLDVGPDGSSCRPADGESADLTLGLTELSAIWMGEQKATGWADAARIREDRPGALLEADALFASARPLHSSTGF